MNDPSLASLLPRLFISMAVVLVVMYVAARVLQNRKLPGSGSGKLSGKKSTASVPGVQVLGRSGVGKGSAVSIVRAGNKTLVLGVTNSSVTLLTELDDDVVVETESEPHWTGAPSDLEMEPGSPQAWTGLLAQVRERTLRRAS